MGGVGLRKLRQMDICGGFDENGPPGTGVCPGGAVWGGLGGEALLGEGTFWNCKPNKPFLL